MIMMDWIELIIGIVLLGIVILYNKKPVPIFYTILGIVAVSAGILMGVCKCY